MALPLDYWRHYQRRVTSLNEYLEVVSALAETWPHRSFVWRGASKSTWALHSSLYRRASAKEGLQIREVAANAGGRSFRDYERDIFDEARRWGLQRNAVDRLSALEALAALQHQGVPTRLLDFTQRNRRVVVRRRTAVREGRVTGRGCARPRFRRSVQRPGSSRDVGEKPGSTVGRLRAI